MQEDGEHSDSNESNNSSQSPHTRSSRMRRATFPVDDEDVPSQGESSQESSPRSYSPSASPRTPESPNRPPLPPARSIQSPLRPSKASFQGQSQMANGLVDTQQEQKVGTSYSGNFDGQAQEDDRQYQSSSPKQVPERRKSVDDGFNSDPEQSSRAMRLQATHQSHSENSHRAPPGVPRPKGIRRAASEAQLLTKYAGRAGTAQKLGSFGSHTSDSTHSFDEYLRNHRSPSPSPKSRQAFVACAYTASAVCFHWGMSDFACVASVMCSVRRCLKCLLIFLKLRNVNGCTAFVILSFRRQYAK